MAADDEFVDNEAFESEDDEDLEIESLDELGDLDDDDGDDDEDEAFDDDDLVPDEAFEADDATDDKDDEEADDEEADDEEADDEEADDEEEEEEEELDEAEESLDVLLAREKVLDEDDVGRADDPREGVIPTTPIGAGEFTCRSCFLVKRRAQLADEERLICFDCA